MGIAVTLLLLAAVIGFAYWWFKVRRVSLDDDSSSEQTLWGKQFVSGAHSKGVYACDRAIETHGQCFDLKNLPTVPLPGCDTLNCHCRLMPLAERRIILERRCGKERREMVRFFDFSGEGKPERRLQRDRRKDRDTRYHWDQNI